MIEYALIILVAVGLAIVFVAKRHHRRTRKDVRRAPRVQQR